MLLCKKEEKMIKSILDIVHVKQTTLVNGLLLHDMVARNIYSAVMNMYKLDTRK